MFVASDVADFNSNYSQPVAVKNIYNSPVDVAYMGIREGSVSVIKRYHSLRSRLYSEDQG